jgi:hypothetical protein
MIDERSSIVQSAYQDIDTPFGNEKDKYMK